MNEFLCGGYHLTSKFDSGNLDRVELVEQSPAPDQSYHTEIKVWTRPDCGGTLYENPNRSWFYFGVCGGTPFTVLKLTVMNLNKQAKLFGQGMVPVLKIGDTGKWERIKEKPTYKIEEDNFILSFTHHPLNMTSVYFYYAFTFPYTYTEMLKQLDRYDATFSKSDAEIQNLFSNIQNRVTSNNNSCEDIANKPIGDGNNPPVVELEQFVVINSEMTNTEAEQQKDKVFSFENMENLATEIYYHREFLIKSLEGRRIDLLTISSFHDILPEREERLNDLFMDENIPRCHKFKNKKIIFISSRVHPGETPSSFVLNGFLNLLLNKANIIAQTLRKMYVFKIIPMLNPDGVFNGFYRSDTLGHNLNRFYLNPQIENHPAIFAVRRLIRFYHYGQDIPEIIEPLSTSLPGQIKSTEKKYSVVSLDNDVLPSEVINHIKAQIILNTAKAVRKTRSTGTQATDTSWEFEESKVGFDWSDICSMVEFSVSAPSDPLKSIEKLDDFKYRLVRMTEKESIRLRDYHWCRVCAYNLFYSNIDKCEKEVLEKIVYNTSFMSESSFMCSTCGFSRTDENQNRKFGTIEMNENTPTPPKEESNENQVDNKVVAQPLEKAFPIPGSSGMYVLRSPNDLKEALDKIIQDNRNTLDKKLIKTGNRRKALSRHSATKSTIKKDVKPVLPSTAKFGKRKGNQNGDQSESESSKFESNVFLYIDLHGHASKKGNFMYGNYLPNTMEAIECMLLPRLMTMNCHHFHFDACVFSERNMYHKGKRDGLSKEGSGRVAVYKTIGLIKSYTLESNYNTGKCVNILPPRGKESGCKKMCLVPPKYTPGIFEEVGKAIGPSILDLTGSNPLSRLPNSEFRTLQGLRNALRHEVDKNFSKTSVDSPPKAKRNKNSNKMPLEVSRKGLFNIPWDIIEISPGSTRSVTKISSSHENKTEIQNQLRPIMNNKPTEKSKALEVFTKVEALLNNKKIKSPIEQQESDSAVLKVIEAIDKTKKSTSNASTVKKAKMQQSLSTSAKQELLLKTLDEASDSSNQQSELKNLSDTFGTALDLSISNVVKDMKVDKCGTDDSSQYSSCSRSNIVIVESKGPCNKKSATNTLPSLPAPFQRTPVKKPNSFAGMSSKTLQHVQLSNSGKSISKKLSISKECLKAKKKRSTKSDTSVKQKYKLRVKTNWP